MLFKIVSEHNHLNVSEENEKNMSFRFRQTWVWMAALALSNLHVCVLSCFSRSRLCATLWIVAGQAPLSTAFSRREYWSVLPFPSPRDLRDPGIKPTFLRSLALVGSLPLVPPGNPLTCMTGVKCITSLVLNLLSRWENNTIQDCCED